MVTNVIFLVLLFDIKLPYSEKDVGSTRKQIYVPSVNLSPTDVEKATRFAAVISMHFEHFLHLINILGEKLVFFFLSLKISCRLG